MPGESLDMALEVLRRDEDCDTYGIDIANTTVAQICYFAATSSCGTRHRRSVFMVFTTLRTVDFVAGGMHSVLTVSPRQIAVVVTTWLGAL
jgi:hypothetical protein